MRVYRECSRATSWLLLNILNMANCVDNEVGSSSGAERMTRSRARQGQGERAANREADTLARRTARVRQSLGERAATRDAHTLRMRTARAPTLSSFFVSIMGSHTHSHHCTFWAQLFRINAFVIVQVKKPFWKNWNECRDGKYKHREKRG